MTLRYAITRLEEETRILSDVIAGLKSRTVEPQLALGERNDLILANRQARESCLDAIGDLHAIENLRLAPESLAEQEGV